MQNTQGILVTGATGFVAQHLIEHLVESPADSFAGEQAVGTRVIGTSRQAIETDRFESKQLVSGEYQADWFDGIDTVIHCAALTNVGAKTQEGQLTEYRAANVDTTKQLAELAANKGVRRFIFLSTIKVNGEQTFADAPYSATDTPKPEDAYGISKWEAEQALHDVAKNTGLEVVIIRPPLVYGPGVKGNFLAMSRGLCKGLPLPFGAIHNTRSLVNVGNLVDLIKTCITHPSAANKTFLVSDDDDLSTTELLKRLAAALDKKARLLPVPSGLMSGAAKLLGKENISRRLLGDLALDIEDTKRLLNWTPPQSVELGLKQTADWFLEQK